MGGIQCSAYLTEDMHGWHIMRHYFAEDGQGCYIMWCYLAEDACAGVVY